MTFLLLVSASSAIQAQSSGCDEVGCVRATPRLASISSEDGVLLNALVGGLLGTSVTLTAVEWDALAQADLNLLDFLEVLQADLGVGSPDQVLNTDVTLLQIVDAAIDVAQTDGNTAAVNALQQLRVSIDALSPLPPIQLGDLLNISTNETSLSDVTLNILELIQGSISLFNYNHVASTPSPVTLQGADLGIADIVNSIELWFQVLEPPVYSCGGAGTEFYSAGVRMKLDVDLVEIDITDELLAIITLPDGVSNLQASVSRLELYTAVARGQGVISTLDAINKAITIDADPGVADLYLGQIDDSIFFNRSAVIDPVTDLGEAKVGDLTADVLGVPIAANINARAFTEGNDPLPNLLSFVGSYPQKETVGNSSAFITNLISTLFDTLEVNVEVYEPDTILDPLVQETLDELIAILEPALVIVLEDVLTPVLNTILTTVVDPTLEFMGTGLGEMDVTAAGIQRNCVALLAGFVYEDVNHNAHKESTEDGTGLTLYAKRIDKANPAQADTVVVVDPTTGAYDLGVCEEGSYQIIVDDNNNDSDVTPYKPPEWVGTEAPNQLIDNVDVIGPREWTDLNFGLFHGSKVVGNIFNDNGLNGGTPHNGVLDGGEKDLPDIIVRALSSGSVEIDRTKTDGEGEFTLWIENTYDGQQVLIREEQGQQYVSVTGNPGTTGGTYNRTEDQITYTNSSGTEYDDITFADVPANSFAPLGRQYANAGSVIFYRHNYIARTPGEVVFNLEEDVSPANDAWQYSLYEDVNCNGEIDAGTDTEIQSPMTMTREQKLCMVVRIQVPAGIEAKAQHVLNITGDFTLSTTAISYPKKVHDETIVGIPSGAGLVLEKTVDKQSANPGESLTYTVMYKNTSSEPLEMLSVDDSTPSYTVFTNAGCGTLPNSLTNCNIQSPAAGAEGEIIWEFEGVLDPGRRGTLTFEVTIMN